MPAILLLAGISLLSGILLPPGPGRSAAQQVEGPSLKVLLTNDDGITDPPLAALAREFRRAGARVVVVAPLEDRSGTSNYISAFGSGRLEAQRWDLGEGIEAYAVDGYPGDAVTFALTGLLTAEPPDLVISGINGGPNLGDAWMYSGTIGAARTAAYLGVPAIAVSGLRAEDPEARTAVARWVVEFARTAAVRALVAPEYLTVSLPPIDPREIRGLAIVHRARGTLEFHAEPVAVSGAGSLRESWSFSVSSVPVDRPGTDAAAISRGQIAIVPMQAAEYDGELAGRITDALKDAALPGR